MGLIDSVIRKAAPLPVPEDFQRYLFIGPHPDDIEIGAGATAAKLAQEGKEICFLICTDGRYGDGHLPGRSGDEVASIRKEESIRSAAMLGVTDVRFLEFSDGGFYKYQDLVRKIAEVVGDFKPEVILAPDPDVISECHPDHQNVGKAAKRIACVAPYPGIMKGLGAAEAPVQALCFYMTARPTRYVGTTGYLEKQIASIKTCHVSQFPPDQPDFDAIEIYLKLRAYVFGIKSRHRTAEGFRVLGPTHMHCLPEAGNIGKR